MPAFIGTLIDWEITLFIFYSCIFSLILCFCSVRPAARRQRVSGDDKGRAADVTRRVDAHPRSRRHSPVLRLNLLRQGKHQTSVNATKLERDLSSLSTCVSCSGNGGFTNAKRFSTRRKLSAWTSGEIDILNLFSLKN